jgi:hypothetical protein
MIKGLLYCVQLLKLRTFLEEKQLPAVSRFYCRKFLSTFFCWRNFLVLEISFLLLLMFAAHIKQHRKIRNYLVTENVLVTDLELLDSFAEEVLCSVLENI